MKLIKPINVYGNKVAELTFREPNGDDVIKCGFPWANNDTMRTRVIDTAAVGRYIEVLGGIPEGPDQKAIQGLPPGSVRQLCPVDLTRAMGQVLNFFLDIPEAQTS